MATIVIDKKEFEVEEEWMNQQELLFYVDNPRVFNALRENGNENPSQAEIEAKMRSMDHVKELKCQIEQNGGLIEPLIVINRNEEYIVIEGNSRLAAYRILAGGDPIKWGKVRVNILPKEITEDDIDKLLGTYHLTPKKEWSKYEKASYIYRMHQRGDCQESTLAKKTGLSVSAVKKYLQVYAFMVDNNDTTQSHWNCYEQYVGNKSLQEYRHNPELDKIVVEQIKKEQIQAKDIRDKLGKMAKTSGKVVDRIVRDYTDGKVDLDGAFTRFEATGKSGNNFNKIKNFRSLVTSEDFKLALKTEAVGNNSIAFELKKIKKEVDKLLGEIENVKH